jgi:hypothetical protein
MASAPAPTHHVPTARPNSLFKLRCASERNAHAYPTCQHRQRHLPCSLFQHDCHRPEASLGGVPPISRAPHYRNTLLIQHS